jgi:ABC-type ATPase involved in cell division
LSLSEDEINANPSSLSPSAQYVFGIACACVQSTADAVYVRDDGDIELPCPILLLDELIDFETSIVANRIGKSLKELSRAGAVIITATHRPQYLKSFADRMITLSSGMILLSEKL